MVVDHSLDHLVWDNTESGSIELQCGGGTSSVTVEIEVMLRGPWRHRADGQPVALEGNIIAFSIPQLLLNPNDEERIISRNDVIVGEDRVRFTVLFAELSMAGSHWYCGTVAEQ